MAYLGLSQPWDQAIQREPFAPPEYSTELPMTPQQIEAQVKQIQPAQGGGLALAAIAAYLILGA